MSLPTESGEVDFCVAVASCIGGFLVVDGLIVVVLNISGGLFVVVGVVVRFVVVVIGLFDIV